MAKVGLVGGNHRTWKLKLPTIEQHLYLSATAFHSFCGSIMFSHKVEISASFVEPPIGKVTAPLFIITEIRFGPRQKLQLPILLPILYFVFIHLFMYYQKIKYSSLINIILFSSIFSLNVGNVREYYVECYQSHITML